MNKRHYYYSLPMIFLVIVAVAGWFATDHLGNKARHAIIAENRASLLSVSTYLSSTFTNLEGAARSLAGSPWIVSALISKKGRDVENANSVLDRYNSALNASVSYLMDARGMTLASSNRKDPDSFVGKSYLFRPYFKEAAGGLAGRYFALGVTSGKRGFYASCPVRDRSGKVLGVVTIKKDLDDIEDFFKRYAFCFLINPDGIIFLSSSPEMVMKTLYPLDKAVQEQLIASRQFGNKPFETVFLKNELAHGTEVTLEGQDYFVAREVIDSGGWSIVLLTSADHIRIYKLTGILATISVCLLIMIFSGVIYFTGRAAEAIRRIEEDKNMLLYAAGEGIFGLDAAGQVTFINPAAMRMLGFTEVEALGKNAHSLIHHSRKDGSSYPAEECLMCVSSARDAGSHAADEVLWRKDGSSFSAECSSMPIIKGGKVIGAVVTFKDITERKRLEELLQKSEEKHRLLFDSAGDAIFVVDREARILAANQLACERLGYSNAELVSMTIGQIDSTAEAPLVPERVARSMEQGRFTFETVHRCKDGSLIPTEVSAKRITWDGQLAILSICRDITERKRVEEELRKSEGRFKAIFDSAGDGILLADLSSKKFLQGNSAICSMLGYTEEEIKGLTVCDIHPPEDVPRVLDEFGKQARGEKVVAENLPVLRKDGSTFHADIGSALITTGEVQCLIGIFRDITERKKTEKALSESEERFRKISTSARDAIIMMDSRGTITYWNEAAERIFGHTTGEAMGKELHALIAPQKYYQSSLKGLSHFVKTGEGNAVGKTLELIALRKDGTEFPIELSLSAVHLQNGWSAIGILRDITERRQVEEMLLNEKNKFLTLSEGAPFGVVLIDKEGKFIYINPRFKELFGYDMEDVPDGRTWFEKAYPDPKYRKTVVSAWLEDLKRIEAGHKRPRIFKVRCKDGTEKIINFIPVQLETGENMMSCDDITEQKRLEQQLHTVSVTDELTGLYNRRGFITLSEQQLKIADRAKKGMLLFFADLDRMKHINDTLGHQAGDMALVEIAAVLKEVFRESDIIGRMGGDEFAVLAIDAADEARETLTDRLNDTIDNYNRREGRKYQLSLSIGTACYDPEGPSTLDELMIKADTLMYEEKRNKQD